MWRAGIVLAAGTLILTNGVVEGWLSNRWQRSKELELGIYRLSAVPMTIGDWRAKSEDLEEAILARAGVEGYLFRHYQNHLNGKKITVLLMCGRPGPLGVHTPDICYRGAGYHLNGPIAKWPQKYGNGNGKTAAEFSRAKFSRDDLTDSASVRIEWTWGAEGKWQIHNSPRMAFARLPVLFKLYVVQTETPANERADEETCRAFLEQLLPALDTALFPIE
jgi:Protein of unknown function (DUF3485)